MSKQRHYEMVAKLKTNPAISNKEDPVEVARREFNERRAALKKKNPFEYNYRSAYDGSSDFGDTDHEDEESLHF